MNYFLRGRTHNERRRAVGGICTQQLRTRLLVQSLETRAVPATFVVSNLNDGTVNGPGQLPGSLRQAVFDTNQSSGTDTITFEPGLEGTINLTQGQLVLSNGDCVFVGNGASKTIINNSRSISSTSRIFNASFTTFKLTMTGMTLSGGNLSSGNGAAILLTHDVSVTLNGVVVTNNKTAGDGAGISFDNDGTLNLIDCTISNNKCTGDGGAVNFEVLGGGAELVLQSTTVSGNEAGSRGGGVYMERMTNVRISNSTISGNAAKSGAGGGFYFRGTVITLDWFIRNSTISGNSAFGGGGGIAFGNGTNINNGSAFIQNSTVTNNTSSAAPGGAIAVINGFDVIKIQSSIVSGNLGVGAPDISSKNFVNVYYSAIGSSSGFILSGFKNLPIGTPLNLGPLADNGGPTQTHFPGPGSRLRGAGYNPVSLATDQRGVGFPRQTGTRVDIGAVESYDINPTAIAVATDVKSPLGPTYVFTVTYEHDVPINTDSIIGNNNAVRVTGPNSYDVPAIYVSIDDTANGLARTATYQITPPGDFFDVNENGLYTISMEANQVYDLANVPVLPGAFGNFQVLLPQTFFITNNLDGPVSIVGQLPGSLRQAIFDANAVNSADNIVFDSGFFSVPRTITLTAGQIDIRDSAVFNQPNAKVTINGNNMGRILTISNKNVLPISVQLTNILFTGGKLTGLNDGGAACWIDNDQLNISNCELSNNITAGDGGALFASGETAVLNLTQCLIQNNSTTFEGHGGGGLGVDRSTVNIVDCTFSSNSTPSVGGGIALSNGKMTIDRSTFTKNSSGTAQNGGGAILMFGSDVIIRNSTFSGNTAKAAGAIGLATTNKSVLVQNCTITKNTATSSEGGGGILARATGSITLQSNIIAGNTSTNGPDLKGFDTVKIGNNLIGVLDGIFVDLGNNLTGTISQPLDPLLGPLSDNGGPTYTHAPLIGSPVFNKGSNPGLLTTDQRGYSRSIGTAVDIGAIEINFPTMLASIADRSVSEGSLLTLTAVATDPDAPPQMLTFSLDAASLAAGSTIDAKTGVVQWTPTDGPTDSRNITVFVTDDAIPPQTVSQSFKVNVSNVEPIVTVPGGDGIINNFDTLTRSGSFLDPGSGPTETFNGFVNYGDGRGVQPLPLNPDRTFDLNHQFMSAGKFTVTVGVRDDDMSVSSFSTTSFQVQVLTNLLAIDIDDGTNLDIGNVLPNTQHSVIRRITLTFDDQIGMPLGVSSFVNNNITVGGLLAIQVLRQDSLTFDVLANHIIEMGRSTVALTFAGGNQASAIVGGSLADGNYSLNIFGENFDVNDGVVMGPRSLEFFRFFGDVNGDRFVDHVDRLQFKLAKNAGSPLYRSYCDYDNDGDVDVADLFQFMSRFKTELMP